MSFKIEYICNPPIIPFQGGKKRNREDSNQVSQVGQRVLSNSETDSVSDRPIKQRKIDHASASSRSSSNMEIEQDFFSSLPTEILCMILAHLPLNELLPLERVSRAWKEIFSSNESLLWVTYKETCFPKNLPLQQPFDISKSFSKNMKMRMTSIRIGKNDTLQLKDSAALTRFLINLPEVKYNAVMNDNRPPQSLPMCITPLPFSMTTPVRTTHESTGTLAFVFPSEDATHERRAICFFAPATTDENEKTPTQKKRMWFRHTILTRQKGTATVRAKDFPAMKKNDITAQGFIVENLKRLGYM